MLTTQGSLAFGDASRLEELVRQTAGCVTLICDTRSPDPRVSPCDPLAGAMAAHGTWWWGWDNHYQALRSQVELVYDFVEALATGQIRQPPLASDTERIVSEALEAYQRWEARMLEYKIEIYPADRGPILARDNQRNWTEHSDRILC